MKCPLTLGIRPIPLIFGSIQALPDKFHIPDTEHQIVRAPQGSFVFTGEDLRILRALDQVRSSSDDQFDRAFFDIAVLAMIDEATK